MDSAVAIGISSILAYLIGSIPTSYIFTRILLGTDIRQQGSGNAGATNVFRVVGKLPGALTLIVDILKGVFVVVIVASYSYRYIDIIDFPSYQALLGFITVCGHIWSVFLGFKGGKGVATTIGVGIIIAPWVFLLTLLIWLAVFILSNYVSLASIVALTFFPIICAAFGCRFAVILLSVAICAIVIYRHKSNIERLLKARETKTIIFKPKKA